MKDGKVIDMEVAVENEEVKGTEEIKENWLAKAKVQIKKHGKTIAVVTGVVLVGVISFIVGKQSVGQDSTEPDMDNDETESNDEPEEVETTEF